MPQAANEKYVKSRLTRTGVGSSQRRRFFSITTILTLIPLALGGCSLFGGGGSAKPAETVVTPGSSQMRSDSDIQQPSTTKLTVKAERAPEPAPIEQPAFRVRVRVVEPQ